MSSTPLTRPQSAWLAPKTILFALIGLMLLYVLYHTEHFLIDPIDPSWPHYREVASWLLPHGLIGALALTLAFMQFNQGHARRAFTAGLFCRQPKPRCMLAWAARR